MQKFVESREASRRQEIFMGAVVAQVSSTPNAKQGSEDSAATATVAQTRAEERRAEKERRKEEQERNILRKRALQAAAAQ